MFVSSRDPNFAKENTEHGGQGEAMDKRNSLRRTWENNSRERSNKLEMSSKYRSSYVHRKMVQVKNALTCLLREQIFVLQHRLSEI